MEITEEKLKEIQDKAVTLISEVDDIAVNLEDNIELLRIIECGIDELRREIALLIKKAREGPS